MPSYKTRFCAYPSAFIYKSPRGKGVGNRAKHLFWGDTVEDQRAGQQRLVPGLESGRERVDESA